MEIRKANVIFSKNGNGFTTNKITLPVEWVRKLGCSLDDKEVIITFEGNEIKIIKKERFSMKQWAVIRRGDSYEELIPCKSKEEAIEEAKKLWKHLTRFEQKRNQIIAGTVNLDADGDYYINENGNIDGDIYEIAVEFPEKEEW